MSSPPPKRIKVSVENEGFDMAVGSWQKKQEFTDVVFVVGDREFPAHKMVLASQSEYFKSMLYGQMKEASSERIKLSEENITPDAFEKIVQYVYTKSLEITEPFQDILDLFRAADYLRFESLKLKLREYLTNNIDFETVLQLYVFSDSYNLQDLHEKCQKYIEGNPQYTLKSDQFVELPEKCLIDIISLDTFVVPENAIVQSVLKWKEKNGKSVEGMEKITECIRFSRFTLKEIFKNLVPSGLFSETRLLEGIRELVLPVLSEAKPRGRTYTGNILQHSRQIAYEHSEDIDLPQCYLVNYLSFEMSSDSNRFTHYNYTIQVTIDKYRWILLFDYTCQCRGRQVLLFPKIPVKSVRIKITNMKIKEPKSSTPKNSTPSRRQETPTKVHYHTINCIKLSENIPFRFMKGGVIAPLCDYNVEYTPFLSTSADTHYAEAFFNQPYSASTLTITVIHDNPDASFFNFTVLFQEKTPSISKYLKHIDIRCPVVVEFEEMVISYVKVIVQAIDLEKGKNDGRVSITSIKCRSSATTDDVNMDEWSPFLTSSC